MVSEPTVTALHESCRSTRGNPATASEPSYGRTAGQFGDRIHHDPKARFDGISDAIGFDRDPAKGEIRRSAGLAGQPRQSACTPAFFGAQHSSSTRPQLSAVAASMVRPESTR